MSLPAKVTIEHNPASADHAALRAVKAYWEEKRGERRMAARRDILPAELREYLPQILLVDVLPGATDFRYRLVGSKLRPYFPREATGKNMREALAAFGENTVSSTLEVYGTVAAGTPLRITGPGHLYAQQSKFFEAMLLPLSDDDREVNMIFGAFEFEWKAQHL
jgi:hypothetical protein